MIKKTLASIGIVAGLLLVVFLFTAQTVKVRKPISYYGASAHLDKMNTIYMGLENPLSVGVHGLRPDQVDVKLEGGTMKGTGSILQYTITPNNQRGKAKLTVSVKGQKGFLRSDEFRVRPVPDPMIILGANGGNTIVRGELIVSPKVSAGLGADFAFEGIAFQVLGFTFTHVSNQGGGVFQTTVGGSELTPDIRSRMLQVRPGDMIIISNVMVDHPTIGKRVVNGHIYTVE